MRRLEGKRIIVTGGTSGIGLACVKRFAAEGAKVAVVGRQQDRTESVAAALREEGLCAIGVACDITKATEREELVKAVCQAFGGIDVLVNNAAWWGSCNFMDMKQEQFQSWVSDYLEATYFISQSTARSMIDGGIPGNIIHIASAAALYGERGMSAYCVSKAAILNMTRAMALELGEYGIRVNCVAPGTTIRENESRPDNVMEAFRVLTPLERLNTTDDVARAIAMMCSDDSVGISGQVVVVDGGFSSAKMTEKLF